MSETICIPAKWTNDCGGKKDFDAKLVSLSTRYWPRGGGFLSYDGETGAWRGNKDRPNIKPSAKSTIYLGNTCDEFYAFAVAIAEKEFEGETEEQVKAAVEQWATEQYAKICDVLRAAFAIKEAT